MSRYSDNITDQYGRPVQGASVYVYAYAEEAATLTADGGGALSNPVTTDSSGGFYFNAADGVYILEVWLNGRKLYRDEAVLVGSAPPIPDSVLVPLAATTGATLIGWIRNATGAVARTVADWFDDRPSVMDFIPFADRVQIRLGTSATDVRAYIQAAIDAVSARGGGDLLVPPGTYRVVINTGVTDKGLIVKPGVRLLAYGATVNMECTGSVHGVRLKSFASVEGGTWAVTVSSTPGTQSIWHSPISAGDAYSEGGTVASPSSFHSVAGWSIRNVTLTSARSSGADGGAGIALYGGVSAGVIENITFPSSSTLYGCVHSDWGFLGTISSSDVAGSRTNFNAGTAYTTHPHDITIRGLSIGAMTAASSIPVRISGGYNITVEDVFIEQSTIAGVYHHAGDLGFEFAPAAVKPMRSKGNVFRNITVKDANNGWGFYADYVADQIRNAVSGGYSALLPAISRANMTIENFASYSDGGASVVAGIRVQEAIGVRIVNPVITGHKQGILIETGADDVHVIGGAVHGNREDGLYAHHGSDKPENLLVEGLRAYQNDTSAGGTASNIRIEGTINATVRGCTVGLATETALYGIRANSNAVGLTLEDNTVVAGKAATGIGISIGSSTDYGILRKFRNNTVAAGVFNPYSGVDIVTEDTLLGSDDVARRLCYAARAALSSDRTPPSGAWVAGEKIRYVDPVAGGFEGSVCVTSGSPGTWKKTGAVEA